MVVEATVRFRMVEEAWEIRPPDKVVRPETFKDVRVPIEVRVGMEDVPVLVKFAKFK